MEKIEKLAELWQKAKYPVIFTGAGISTASGIPDFRSKTGLWKQRPESLATLNALYNMPGEFYFFYQWRLSKLWQIEPNLAHKVVAEQEKNGRVNLVITQNVDGLHQRAGSVKVSELHGTMYTVSCLACGASFDSKIMAPPDKDFDKIKSEEYQPGPECFCQHCGANLRPDVVLFGEPLPEDNWQQSVQAAQKSDFMLVIGSSLLVGPANMLPVYTLRKGGKLAIINNDPTHLDSQADVVINDDISKTLLQVQKLLN